MISYWKFIFLLWIISWIFTSQIKAQDKALSVFDAYRYEQNLWIKYSNNANALYNHISTLAEKCLLESQLKVSGLDSGKEWKDYLQKIHEKCFSGLDKFEKTPLNVTITGIIERDEFVVEKTVFESIPGFYVTGCLFKPKTGQLKYPAIIVAIGHSQAAFRREIYQQGILNLVKKGFIVFTFDPIGQGERLQYYDPASNKSLIGGSTFEHSYAGAQCLLTGYSISDYFIWDGVRALDYLFSRSDVDTTRVGMTGVSGGGTQTAFLSAFDKRIYAAAPECYITSYQRLFESIGPQDAEQNLYRGLKRGIDHADLLSMRAPLPTHIISTTQDFFSIQGARETYGKTKEVFKIFNSPANLSMAEADGTHGSKKDNRESMYQFFSKHLKHPVNGYDEQVSYFNEEEFRITQTGQVLNTYSSKTIFNLNSERATRLIKNRFIKSAEDLFNNKEFILGKIQELSGYDSTRTIQSVVYTGKVEKESYKIEKYFIQGKDFHYPIPFILIKSNTENKNPLLLYLSPSGKEGLLNNEEAIKRYIKKGYSILAPDLIGTGELKNTAVTGDSYIQDYSYNLWFGANLVGQSIAGMQASDLEVMFRYIRTRDDIDTENVTAMVTGEACSSFLHFAVFNNFFNKVILVNPLISFENIIITQFYKPQYLWTAVPGALEYYDLSFLTSLLSPSQLIIMDPVYSNGEAVNKEQISDELFILKDYYKINKAQKQLKIIVTNKKHTDFCVPDFL